MRLPEVVLGVMLVAGCALAAVIWQQRADTTTTIVVAGRAIPRGTEITAADLRGAEIGGETGAMVSGQDALTLIGRVAVVDIGADVPMTMSLLADAQPLGVDEALTSVALAPGRLPPDLAAGDDVRIVIITDAGPSAEPVTSLIGEPAVVWAVDAAPDGVDTVVTVRGPISLAAQMTSASVVQLVRVSGG